MVRWHCGSRGGRTVRFINGIAAGMTLAVVCSVYLSKAASGQLSGQPTSTIAKAGHPPVMVAAPEPDYPAAARDRFLEGQCVISLRVGTNGAPQDAKVVHCSDVIFASNSLIAVGKYVFQPARDNTGNPVVVPISIEIDFHLADIATEPIGRPTSGMFRYGIVPLEAQNSSGPLPKGVYALTTAMESPKLARLPDESFVNEAFRFRHGLHCEVALTINKKGIASDPVGAHCNEQAMTIPAVTSLLSSKFDAARLNGKAISVRVVVGLAYVGTADPK